MCNEVWPTCDPDECHTLVNQVIQIVNDYSHLVSVFSSNSNDSVFDFDILILEALLKKNSSTSKKEETKNSRDDKIFYNACIRNRIDIVRDFISVKGYRTEVHISVSFKYIILINVFKILSIQILIYVI